MSSRPRPFTPLDFKMRHPALDGLRALAVTMVFAIHYGNHLLGGPFFSWAEALRTHGWIGIDLFFVLSGFLITGILYDTRSDTHFFKRFYARRSVRIFPVFYLVFAVLLAATPVFHYQWRVGHLWFLVYLGNIAQVFDPTLVHIVPARHGAPNAFMGHFWSLCVEEQFYLLWPLIVWHIHQRAALIRIAAGLSAAALALRIIFIFLLPPETYIDRIAQVTPFRMDTLLIGAILALVLRGPAADRWQRSSKWFFLCATVIVVAFTLVSPSRTSRWLVTIGLSLIALASAGLIRNDPPPWLSCLPSLPSPTSPGTRKVQLRLLHLSPHLSRRLGAPDGLSRHAFGLSPSPSWFQCSAIISSKLVSCALSSTLNTTPS